MILDINDIDKIVSLLQSEKIGILPTDTIYGIHCLASRKDLVDKINYIKGRDKITPFITLISDKNELDLFKIKLNKFENSVIEKYWPGPNTLIFDSDDGNTKSFRIPDNSFLISIIKRTGPLVSTSANPHDLPPSKNITQAIKYFDESVDFYVDGGDLNNPPSSVYKISNNVVDKLR